MENNQTNGKASFVVYVSWYDAIKELSDSDLGKLFRAMFSYQITGNLPKLEPKLQMAFEFMRYHFDKDREKYLKRCEANRRAVNKRWQSET